jgi:hypothetical protein
MDSKISLRLLASPSYALTAIDLIVAPPFLFWFQIYLFLRKVMQDTSSQWNNGLYSASNFLIHYRVIQERYLSNEPFIY